MGLLVVVIFAVLVLLLLVVSEKDEMFVALWLYAFAHWAVLAVFWFDMNVRQILPH